MGPINALRLRVGEIISEERLLELFFRKFAGLCTATHLVLSATTFLAVGSVFKNSSKAFWAEM